MTSHWEYGVFCDRSGWDEPPSGPRVVLLVTGPSPEAARIQALGRCTFSVEHQHRVQQRWVSVGEWIDL